MEIEQIERALKNDDEAFVQLIMEKKDKLTRIARRYCFDDTLVEDALGETVYQAYRNRKKCRHPEYVDTWLVRILINACHAELKKVQKYAPLEVDVSDGHEEDIPLRTLVLNMEEPQRTILILYFFEGYTLNEIAQCLQMPLSTCKSKYYKILKDLKIELMEVKYE